LPGSMATRAASKRKRGSAPVSPADSPAARRRARGGGGAAADEPTTLVTLFDPRPSDDQLAGLREEHQLIDGVLKVGAVRLDVHKVIVCSYSPFLRQLFTAGLAESDKKQVELVGVEPTSVGALVDSMYTGRLALAPSTVCGVLKTANRFQMDTAEQAAGDFLVEHLEPTTAVAALSFSEQMSVGGSRSRALRDRVFEYVLYNFAAVAAGESFGELSLEILAELLGSDNLMIEREEVALGAALDWVKHDAESRHEELLQLLPLVRFPLLDGIPSLLIEQSELIHKSAAVTKLALRCMSECSVAFKESREAAGCPRMKLRKHLFTGVQFDFTPDGSWQSVYDEPYSASTNDDDLQERCKDFRQLLVGAREAGKTSFALCAVAPPAVVFRKTKKNETHEHRGVHWYRAHASPELRLSMGFSPSPNVRLEAADTLNCYCQDGRGRLSWELLDDPDDPDSQDGGWRAGLCVELYGVNAGSRQWRKVILAR
jgi:hypothetical protein